MTTPQFIDLELGMMKFWDSDCDSDWGLFVVLDEEEKQVSYRKMLKNIIQIETIEEGECEYEAEYNYGKKIDYYTSSNFKTGLDTDLVDKEAGMVKDKVGEDKVGEDDEDEANFIVKKKIQFFITYALTTSFSIALIILTFTI